MFYQDIFYQTDHLNLTTKSQILEDAYQVCYNYHVDKLETGNVQRQRTDMTFNQIFNSFDENCHFVVIYRRGFDDDNQFMGRPSWKGEIGFTTMNPGNDNYFLFIYLTEDQLFDLVDKFELKPNHI